jgi:hypothetical protein
VNGPLYMYVAILGKLHQNDETDILGMRVLKQPNFGVLSLGTSSL